MNGTLAALEEECERFIGGPGAGAREATIELWAEARYPQQVWQLDVPLRVRRFAGAADIAALRDDFHAVHREIFAVDETESEIDVVGWHARAGCRLRDGAPVTVAVAGASGQMSGAERETYFPHTGRRSTPVLCFDAMSADTAGDGPALVELSFTTVVVPPGAAFRRTPAGSLAVTPAPPSAAIVPGGADGHATEWL